MTARANPLTMRASSWSAARPALWTAPAADFRVMLNALSALGYDSAALLAAARVDAATLDDPDARVSCEAFGTMVAAALRERHTPNLALRVAEQTPIGAYPLLDYLVLTTNTLGDAVRQLAQYFKLVGNPVSVAIDDDDDPVRVEMARSPAPFTLEYSVALLVFNLRRETDGRFTPVGASFAHVPDDVDEFARALRCRVVTGAPWNGVTIAREQWTLPMRRGDPVLRRVLERHADETLARMPSRGGIADEVQRALARQVSGGDACIESIARALGTSARTLQRRLAAERTSYQDLLDGARKEAAGRYLASSGMAICEIAYLVGYSEPAPFHRAFKRWFGTTPEAYRTAHRERKSGEDGATVA